MQRFDLPISLPNRNRDQDIIWAKKIKMFSMKLLFLLCVVLAILSIDFAKGEGNVFFR